MVEYIDREKLMEKFCWHCEATACGDDECFYKRTMYSIPVADVQPVKHGRWSRYCCPNCGISKYKFISFNIVGEKEYARPFGTWNYCPRCGAKMDGEDNG